MPRTEKIPAEKVDALLNEALDALRGELDTQREALKKAAPPDEPDEESPGSSGPSAPAPEASAPPSEASAPAGPPAEASAPPAAEASAPPEGSAPPEETPGEIAPAASVEELQAEYAQLPPEELMMHYEAIKAAIVASQGGGAGPEASAPPAPPAGPAGAPPAMKAEGKKFPAPEGNGGEVEKGKMGKSEKDAEIEALREQLAKQEQGLLQLCEVVAAPVRKSIKGLSDLKFIEKTDEPAPERKSFTKAEAMAKLRDKAREQSLSKSDREKINAFSLGHIDVTEIEHLLVDKATK